MTSTAKEILALALKDGETQRGLIDVYVAARELMLANYGQPYIITPQIAAGLFISAEKVEHPPMFMSRERRQGRLWSVQMFGLYRGTPLTLPLLREIAERTSEIISCRIYQALETPPITMGVTSRLVTDGGEVVVDCHFPDIYRTDNLRIIGAKPILTQWIEYLRAFVL